MKEILIRPHITEKTTKLTERPKGGNHYAFIVGMYANKLEIRKAIEDQFGVTVENIRTVILPGKPKFRMTRTRQVAGRTSMYKKAIVRLAGNQEIDFYKTS